MGVPSFLAHRLAYFMDGALNFLYRVISRADESRAAVCLQQLARFPQVG
jgi:hypothetical protein